MQEKTPIPKSIVDEILDKFIDGIQKDNRINDSMVEKLTALRESGGLKSPELVERTLNADVE